MSVDRLLLLSELGLSVTHSVPDTHSQDEDAVGQGMEDVNVRYCIVDLHLDALHVLTERRPKL